MVKLFTIGIPTFNRALYLDKSLNSLLKQVKEFDYCVDVIIADNASTDSTKEVIEKYKNEGFEFRVIRHETNLGPDNNFISLYENCETKYFWLLSDDDILLPNSLKYIIQLLQTEDLGVLYLNGYWYNTSVDYNIVGSIPYKVVKYTDPIKFIERVHYWVTFISSNIINKSIIKTKVDPYLFSNSNLVQLSWTIPAAFSSKCNLVIESKLIACKADNQGGYKLFQVFGSNINSILNRFLKDGYDKRLKKIINNSLMIHFFPIFLNRENKSFIKENYILILFTNFWRYRRFWTNIVPRIVSRELKPK